MNRDTTSKETMVSSSWMLTAAISLENSCELATENPDQRASLPNHNISKEESKALHELKKDRSRVIMKADKGNCLAVLDREEYDSKLESLLADRSTYEVVTRSPFGRIERDLNATLLDFKRRQKIDDYTYIKLRSTDGIPMLIHRSSLTK